MSEMYINVNKEGKKDVEKILGFLYISELRLLLVGWFKKSHNFVLTCLNEIFTVNK